MPNPQGPEQSADASNTFCGTFDSGREAGRLICATLALAAESTAALVSSANKCARAIREAGTRNIRPDSDAALFASWILAVQQVYRRQNSTATGVIAIGVPPERRCTDCPLRGIEKPPTPPPIELRLPEADSI